MIHLCTVERETGIFGLYFSTAYKVNTDYICLQRFIACKVANSAHSHVLHPLDVGHEGVKPVFAHQRLLMLQRTTASFGNPLVLFELSKVVDDHPRGNTLQHCPLAISHALMSGLDGAPPYPLLVSLSRLRSRRCSSWSLRVNCVHASPQVSWLTLPLVVTMCISAIRSGP